VCVCARARVRCACVRCACVCAYVYCTGIPQATTDHVVSNIQKISTAGICRY
jgi:hypothetical protein